MDEYTAGVIIALTKENPIAAAHLFASTREQYGPTKDDATNIERNPKSLDSRYETLLKQWRDSCNEWRQKDDRVKT